MKVSILLNGQVFKESLPDPKLLMFFIAGLIMEAEGITAEGSIADYYKKLYMQVLDINFAGPMSPDAEKKFVAESLYRACDIIVADGKPVTQKEFFVYCGLYPIEAPKINQFKPFKPHYKSPYKH